MNSEDLKEVMAAAGTAFADGLAAHEERQQENNKTRAMMKLRQDALESVQVEFRNLRRRNRDRTVGAVASYCSKARNEALDKVKNDKRMPRSINYLERYNALLGMSDRSEVLRRLDQTIAKAEEILKDSSEVDINTVLTEAANAFCTEVYKLNGIKVVSAEEQIEDETGSLPDLKIFEEADSEKEFNNALETAFMEAFGALSTAEEEQASVVADEDERIKQYAGKLEDAVLAAKEAAEMALHFGAQSVAGNVLKIPEGLLFDGSASLEVELDVELVQELCDEVWKSFKIFREVVNDNGLFAAFATEGTFGVCRGWRFGFWWDDFFYDESEYSGEIPGRDSVRDIPSTVEEDEGGDSLEKSIERMREFNKKKYWGMLDDDFDYHVEAFWYGFKKLMENVNGLYRMNPSSFNKYCNTLAEAAKQATIDMGASSMDTHQVNEFCKAVNDLSKSE